MLTIPWDGYIIQDYVLHLWQSGDNINIISIAEFGVYLNSKDILINHVFTDRYMRYLCNAFVFYAIKRYDIMGKPEKLGKLYAYDTGITYAVLETEIWTMDGLLINKLFRMDLELYVSKLHQKEIDFVAVKGSERLHIQVSDDISNPGTFRCRYEQLHKIRDAYLRTIIARPVTANTYMREFP